MISRQQTVGSSLVNPGRLAVMICVAAVAASACTKTVPIRSTLPSPVVRKLPLIMGVHYGNEFREFVHRESIYQGPNWEIEIGAANVQLFDELFEGMFEQAVPVTDLQASFSQPSELDAIIEPRLEEYAFITPQDTGLKQFAASIKYKLYLHAPDGHLIGSWRVNGYGKSPDTTFNDDEALRQATRQAMRDAAATLALEARKQPAVVQWARERGITVPTDP